MHRVSKTFGLALCLLLQGLPFLPMAVELPPAHFDTAPAAASGSETAVLAGGCFWGMQLVFEHVKAVTRVHGWICWRIGGYGSLR